MEQRIGKQPVIPTSLAPSDGQRETSAPLFGDFTSKDCDSTETTKFAGELQPRQRNKKAGDMKSPALF